MANDLEPAITSAAYVRRLAELLAARIDADQAELRLAIARRGPAELAARKP